MQVMVGERYSSLSVHEGIAHDLRHSLNPLRDVTLSLVVSMGSPLCRQDLTDQHHGRPVCSGSGTSFQSCDGVVPQLIVFLNIVEGCATERVVRETAAAPVLPHPCRRASKCRDKHHLAVTTASKRLRPMDPASVLTASWVKESSSSVACMGIL